MVLEVVGAHPIASKRPLTPDLQEVQCGVEVRVVPGLPGELDQSSLDLGMPVNPAGAGTRPELADDEVRLAARHLEDAVVARAVECDASLDEVAGAVDLMAPDHVSEMLAVSASLPPRTEVPIGLLDAPKKAEDPVKPVAPLRRAGPHPLPANGLEDLEKVRVCELITPVGRDVGGGAQSPLVIEQGPQVVHDAGALEVLDAVGQGSLDGSADALAEDAAKDDGVHGEWS